MKKFSIFAVLCAMATFVLPAVSFAKGEVVVFDAQVVMKNSEEAQKAQESLRQMMTDAEEKLKNLQDKLRNDKEALEKRKTAISEEAYEDEKSKLVKEYREYQLEKQALREKLDRENARLNKDILDVVSSVVENLAKEKGYSLVISKHFLIYNADAIDISEEVLKRVNKELAKK